MKNLPFKLKIYLILVYIFSVLSICLFIKTNYVELNITSMGNILFFSALMAITETFTVPFKKVSYSTSFAIQLAAYMLFGPASTILIIIIGFSFRVLKVNDKYKHIFNTPFYGTVFNYCALILPIIWGNYFYIISRGTFNLDKISSNIVQIMLFSVIVFSLNTLIISKLSSLATNKKIFYCIISNFKLLLINTIAMIPFGIILAFAFYKYTYLGVLLILAPILLVRYTLSLYVDSKTKFVQTVDALMRAMEARDKYTEGHSQRVAELASKIAKELGYSEWKIEQLNIASLLHDVGKIGIDDNILNKPGKLTDEEYETIKKHPEIGYNILKDINGLENIISIARHHHERYDGKGYPDGKNAEELSFDVFIIQLADAVDAMATDRPYRKALSENEILEELKRHSGTQFHPKVVEAYLRIAEKQKKAE
ncbi:HD-GYP domain-containing protein [Clostridium omnivorum]|uniref:HD-GYP domain-containing protein n=1 Tax=Clostridium omnivorum TaxID=1604902 RepID=A0ABQ5N5L3_9CLOT|nr:HD-GYP domain-containing protein [Clostridium sp. E14]GLC30524.1 hypothetical protein bsdE14_19340 [Clostridium sp. E14]